MNVRTLPGSGIVSIFASHPNAANLLMVLMIIFGIFAIARINTQFFPTVEREQVSITVKWPGASAEDIEKNIRAIDIWIGEEAYLGRGYGSAMMKMALRDYCFVYPEVQAVLVDTVNTNVNAHRFYQR